jgi:arsenate reductase
VRRPPAAIGDAAAMTTVLFVCVQNAGRSQMAAAFFNAMADPSVARAVSAGTQPADQIHPEVIAAMDEVDIDLRGTKPALLTEALAADTQWLVTMGCGEACPHGSWGMRMEWELADPHGQPPQRVRAIRDEIRERVRQFIRVQHWQR